MEASPLWAVLTATAPVVLLAVLVVRSRPLTQSAWIAAGLAAVLGLGVFGLDLTSVAIGILRGLWTGGWILAIVVPALLLFEIMDRSGALTSLSDAAQTIAPTEGRRLILLAWVLPSFLQGAAGFGMPIAVAAPMLVRTGMRPALAVATCLIGYQWSVTFGSMGSSFFMASATARLDESAMADFAIRTAVVLGVNCLLSGLLVLSRAGGRRRSDIGVTLVIGAVMTAAMMLTVVAEPAIGTTVGGLAGLIAAWWLLPGKAERVARPSIRQLAADALPYVVLTVVITAGLGIPLFESVLDRAGTLAPVLAGTEASFGHTNPTAPVTPAFRPLQHPLVFVVPAAVVAVVGYRIQGRWPQGTTRKALLGWVKRSLPVVASILGLTVLAAVMIEAGMLEAMAEALAASLGHLFVLASTLVGAAGTVLTGSTTASNALFSSLQAGVAARLDLPASVLLAAQTAGGNVGNSLAPVLAAVGAAAAGVGGEEGRILRHNLPATGVLLLATAIVIVIQALLAVW